MYICNTREIIKGYIYVIMVTDHCINKMFIDDCNIMGQMIPVHVSSYSAFTKLWLVIPSSSVLLVANVNS